MTSRRPPARPLPTALVLLIPTLLPGLAAAETRQAGDLSVEVTPAVTGLDMPWSIDFLPRGGQLITQIDGTLLLVEDGETTEVPGTPEVWANGQGGLLDILVPRDFAESREIYLSYSKPMEGGAGTALGVGTLVDGELQDFHEIFAMSQGSDKGQHFGSRILEAPDGTLYLTVGERGEREAAQDLSRHNGSVLRLNRDGSVPEDNPFVDDGEAQPEIWSYGHRNAQGLALDAEGAIWVNEHGPQGGDEINRIEKGANYGWPLATYGEEYGGGRFAPEETENTTGPLHQWTPSIAPSGYAIYEGDLFPSLRGVHLVGSLKFDFISALSPEDWSETRWEWPETARVRDVTEAPDGSIWFLSETEGTAYRITPAE
ncbi:PQQ-dependent sugar dehydrogenase [Celeribacter indicus]|uniref:Soluble aldose sugar dehydrogenase YliI n=1 Tax=Celeribacter indicus TaxID=1208324 RepID=A0A0B5E4J8_9RHOB|nr:PQQ-dependent sugar dehydrogenase [Celeribacter indicus]AJE47287.1 soluble aldose sugar dehydrogenase YliI [Celeribacter indicus]SDW02506.1 Glucose/arabinose dehydrogenase, beta-propeller fold [Celeribacter indicus]